MTFSHAIIALILTWKCTCIVLAQENLKASQELEHSYFCAICELVDGGEEAKKLEEIHPTQIYFRLNPIKIFWGSFDKVKSSLEFFPVSVNEKKREILVVFRSEENLVEGDWIKKYINITSKEREPEKYLLVGETPISAEMLVKFLENFSDKMRVKFPLD